MKVNRSYRLKRREGKLLALIAEYSGQKPFTGIRRHKSGVRVLKLQRQLAVLRVAKVSNGRALAVHDERFAALKEGDVK